MTRTHCARKLLEHGPLTYGEFMEITGWRHSVAKSVIGKLVERGSVQRTTERGCFRYIYRLAA